MDQFEQAVRYALDPLANPDVKGQAMQYCESVRDSPDGWQLCLELFVEAAARSPESRLFSLQVIDSALTAAPPRLSLTNVDSIRNILFDFIQKRYSTDYYYTQEPAFIKNKLAHTIVLAFVQAYPERWHDFFPTLAKMAGVDAASTRINAYLADFFLKILSSLDEEIINPVVPRSKEVVVRNQNIKDAMRISDTEVLATAWYNVLTTVTSDARPIDCTTPALRSDLVRQTLRLVGVYASWISINLVVNDHFKALILRFFTSDEFCGDAVQTVMRIINKGMQPADKIEVIRYFGVVDIVGQISASATGEDIRVNLANLAKTAGCDLVAVAAKDDAAGSELALAAYQDAEKFVELSLRLMQQDSYHSTTLALIPFISAFLSLYKKSTTTAAATAAPADKGNSRALSSHQRALMSQILHAFIKKLEYDPDHDFSDYSDPKCSIEEGLLPDTSSSDDSFVSLRHEVNTVIDVIAAIDFDLFEATIVDIIRPILESVRQNGVSDTDGYSMQPVGWIRAELALTLIHNYCNWLISARPANLPRKLSASGITRTASIMANTRLPEIMRYMIESNVSSSRHPAIANLYFETCVRQSYFYAKEPQCIKPVLMAFVGETGIRSRFGAVRIRNWYLLYRLLKQVDYTPFAADMIEGIKGLLAIHAEIPAVGEEGYGVFDSQLYLFEAAGMVLSSPNIDDSTRGKYLDELLNPLITQASELVSSNAVSNSPQALLQVHHIITATGSLAKGFPDAKVDNESLTPPNPTCLSDSSRVALKQITEFHIAILKSLHRQALIREAVRFAFSRLLTVLGTEAFGYVPDFIEAIFPSCTAEEWKDILTFLGMVSYNFKAHAAPILANVLLRVSESVFTLVNSIDPQQGTDDAILKAELKTAYLGWILSFFTLGMDPLFWTAQNESGWSIIFKQISEWALPASANPGQQQQSATAFFKPETTKLVLSILYRMADNWLRSELTSSDIQRQRVAAVLNIDINPSTNKKLQARTIEFFETTGLPLLFHICLSDKLNFRDAQTSLIMFEVARTLQTGLKFGGEAWFNSKVLQTFLPQIGCPADKVIEFGQAVSRMSDKQLKQYLVKFFSK
ncbi:pre-tRNA nuclear export protein [Spiromyces aspiralis]|uniref:Pre-tRNA nuclear export protein n=1 Tax=Spiromyces aspiralis TaxID=68401 RepID=A0ACC1HI35_9FUNG|nr:pre-tRNA nuclear export protein [Spiromyces aspiralis]